MKVRDVMTRSTTCCTPETSLYAAARMMAEMERGAIPVIMSPESRKPVGILTDRDLACRVVAKNLDIIKTSVEECMSAPVTLISEDETLERCCEVMARTRLRRLVVVHDQGDCCGIISLTDIAGWVRRDELAKVMLALSTRTAGFAEERGHEPDGTPAVIGVEAVPA